MKVILLQDVKGVGKKHQIVDVNDGYAKNFLIKKNLAVIETEQGLKKLNQVLAQEEKEHALDIEKANQIKQKLEALNLVFYLKSDHHGNAFGKLSVKQVIEAINQQDKIVNKYMFNEKDWGLGKHKIAIKLHPEVVAHINIQVLEEK